MEALKKALTEAGRILVIALIPVAIPMIEAWKIDWKMLVTVGVITILKFVDKYLHEVGKAKDEVGGYSELTKGLVRF